MSAPTLFSYLPRDAAETLCKLAEGKKPNRAVAAAKAIGIPLAGWAGGTVAGFGAGLLADTISQKLMGHPIPDSYLRAIVPAAASLAGLSYGLYKAHEMENLRRALQGHSDKSST